MSARRVAGVDVGGTFTDVFVLDEASGACTVAKVPSTPADQSQGFLAGLAAGAGDLASLVTVVHGTTVALNALLTGRIARTAWVTGEGFRDLIEIGRQERPDIYALHPVRPTPLVPRELRFTVDQRSRPTAEGLVELARPTRKALKELKGKIARSGATAG